jgi:hypothetical protein
MIMLHEGALNSKYLIKRTALGFRRGPKVQVQTWFEHKSRQDKTGSYMGMGLKLDGLRWAECGPPISKPECSHSFSSNPHSRLNGLSQCQWVWVWVGLRSDQFSPSLSSNFQLFFFSENSKRAPCVFSMSPQSLYRIGIIREQSLYVTTHRHHVFRRLVRLFYFI